MQSEHFNFQQERLPVAFIEASSLPWEGYDRVRMITQRGPIYGRFYLAKDSDSAVIMVGGVGGGFDSPADNLYERLALALNAAGISALRVKYRDPFNLEESVHDVHAAIHYLANYQHIRHVGVLGHSFGGAVVISAAVDEPSVDAVAALASQTHGTREVSELARPLLLIHGSQDKILPASCSQDIYRRAQEPKSLNVCDADHGLAQCADEVFERTFDFFVRTLNNHGN